MMLKTPQTRFRTTWTLHYYETFWRSYLKTMASCEQFKAVQPYEYYKRFLENNIRPDGRRQHEFRQTTINVDFCSKADGSSLVRLGNTSCCCGIKAEITTPNVNEPEIGIIVPNVDLPPLCSSIIQNGPPTEYAQATCKLFDDIVSNLSIFDRKQLCIISSKYVWVLYCDIVCLDLDGNLIDCALMSLFSALKNLKLPKITENEKSGLLECDSLCKSKLSLKDFPISSTFGQFDINTIIADPTAEEEGLCNGAVTIILNNKNEVCSFYKQGGLELDDKGLNNCIEKSKSRVDSVRNLLDTVFL